MLEKLRTFLSGSKEKVASFIGSIKNGEIDRKALTHSAWKTFLCMVVVALVFTLLYKFAKVILIVIVAVMALCVLSVLYHNYRNQDERIDD